jgi:hypothetical protein
MSDPAQIVRVHICLEWSGVVRVLDRLSVLGHVPKRMVFVQSSVAEGQLRLELGLQTEAQAVSLIERLEQMPAVRRARIHRPRK